MNFSTASQQIGRHTVLAVSGEVDIYSSPALRLEIAGLIGPGHQLVVDLSGVEFLDSSGLGTLVEGANHAKGAGGDLSLVCPAGAVLKLFQLTGLDQVLTLYPTIDEATRD